MRKLSRFWYHILHISESSYGSLHAGQCRKAPSGKTVDIKAAGGRLIACMSRKDAEAFSLSLQSWLKETRL